MKTAVTLICFICLQVIGQAQTTLRYDTSRVSRRAFSAVRMDGYKSNPEFQYEKVSTSAKSGWDLFWDWVWSKIDQLFNNVHTGNLFFWIILVISVSVLAYFVIQATGMRDGMLFGKRNLQQGLAFSTMEEDIHAIDFDSAIQKATEQGNFRLAVRMLYLPALKKLTDGGKISWKAGKTNLMYWQELSGTLLQEPFFELTRQFESNWYGNLSVSGQEFNQLNGLFREFYTII